MDPPRLHDISSRSQTGDGEATHVLCAEPAAALSRLLEIARLIPGRGTKNAIWARFMSSAEDRFLTLPAASQYTPKPNCWAKAGERRRGGDLVGDVRPGGSVGAGVEPVRRKLAEQSDRRRMHTISHLNVPELLVVGDQLNGSRFAVFISVRSITSHKKSRSSVGTPGRGGQVSADVR